MRPMPRLSGHSSTAVRLVLSLAALVAVLCAATAVARAPLIENGGFESGDLSGWKTSFSLEGAWIPYQGHPDPPMGGSMFGPFPKPQRGEWAAWSDQIDQSTMILYQDFKVPKHAKLQFLTWYQAYADFATPHDLNGDTDNPATHPNEQYRVDLIKPGADIRSLDKSDVLMNLFRTRVGDPPEMRPQKISKSLADLAGQKVRLRFAVTVNEDVLAAGIDGIKVKTSH
jgi:hypothetical protein